MGFWIIAGGASILLALAIWLVVLRSAAKDAKPAAAYDLDVYRDQLKELARDQARGIISSEDAERAKVEISRRILEADRALQAEGGAAPGQVLPLALALMATLGLALFVYARIGAPGYPDVPLQTRIAEIEAQRATRPDQIEAEATAPAFPPVEMGEDQLAALAALREAAEGDEIDTLLTLARAEAQARDYIAARQAQERAIAVMGPRADAEVWVNLARMRVLAAGGYVSPEAEEALRQALALDPGQGDARFLLGAMYQRQNRPDLAFAIWRDLLADSAGDAPWVRPILDQIEEVAFFAGQRIDLATIAPQMARGPSQEQMDAAADMSPEDRLAMIESMVAGLNDRLASEGGPAEDWARLIGAYGVLGNLDAARAILAEARAAFADDADAQALFDQAELSLPAP